MNIPIINEAIAERMIKIGHPAHIYANDNLMFESAQVNAECYNEAQLGIALRQLILAIGAGEWFKRDVIRHIEDKLSVYGFRDVERFIYSPAISQQPKSAYMHAEDDYIACSGDMIILETTEKIEDNENAYKIHLEIIVVESPNRSATPPEEDPLF